MEDEDWAVFEIAAFGGGRLFVLGFFGIVRVKKCRSSRQEEDCPVRLVSVLDDDDMYMQ